MRIFFLNPFGPQWALNPYLSQAFISKNKKQQDISNKRCCQKSINTSKIHSKEKYFPNNIERKITSIVQLENSYQIKAPPWQ